MAICSATSHAFGFPYKRKHPTLDILKYLVTKLRNQDKKASFIQVDENGALNRYFGFMKTCHNMNIIVQTTGGDASSLIVKSEYPNNKLVNITKVLLMNSNNLETLSFVDTQG